MKALILAAGYATRLYPLTREYPKPLLHVEGRPIIDHIVSKLEGLTPLDEIIVVTNSKFISLFKEWKLGLKCAKRISLVDDLTKGLEDRRGAVGDMIFAIKKKSIKSDLLVVGGDNLFEDALSDFVRFAESKKSPVIGTYDIKYRKEASKYGVIKLGQDARVIDFKEKPKSPKSTLVAMCLYYFPRQRLRLFREYLRDKTDGYDATGFYIDWLKDKLPVYGFKFSGRWFDIGDHKYYNKAKEEFAS